jgi:hypothetical protein
MLAKSSNVADVVGVERGFHANNRISFSTEIPVTLHLVNPVILWEIIQTQVMCV